MKNMRFSNAAERTVLNFP